MRQQSAAHRTMHQAEHPVAPAKAHFGLGRMHVDVHFFRRNFQEKDRHGKTSDHQQGVIALKQR